MAQKVQLLTECMYLLLYAGTSNDFYGYLKLDPQYGVIALRTTFLWKHDWSTKDFSDENH
jgi:hypothetical protein